MRNPRAVMAVFLFSVCARADEARDQAVTQAREILGLRTSLKEHLQVHYPDADIATKDALISFRFPLSRLFDEGVEPAPSTERLLGVLRDLAGTYRTLYVSVIYEKSPGSGDAELKTNSRRAMVLGSYFFRECGVPPANLFLGYRAAEKEGLLVVYETRPPTPFPTGQEFQGVMVNLKNPVLDFGGSPVHTLDVSLLTPFKLRKWTLRLLSAGGASVREYQGTSELRASLPWDGKDKEGKPVPPGPYQAFLTASGFGGPSYSDSLSFVVRWPAAAPSSARLSPKLPTTEPTSRKWAFVVHFARNQSDAPDPLEIRQLADNMRLFEDARLVIEGYADSAEQTPRLLAARRAESVRNALAASHEVPVERLTARGQIPRRPLEGEHLEKAVAFFVTEEQ